MRALAVALVALVFTASAVGADGEPRKALTAKGQAAARSIVLKRGDLSRGFVPHEPSDDPRPKAARCGAVDESDLTVTGDADSPNFSRDAVGVAVGSSAQVYRTLAEANAAWRRGASAAGVRCFADLVRLTAPSTKAVTIVSARRIPFPRIAPRATAYRVIATLTVAGKQTVRAYFDAVLLQRGSIQAALVVTSVGRPVAPGDERGVAALLAGRMARVSGSGGPVS